MKFDESRPIWLQIYEEFVIQIVTGNWPPGSKVPSVRELAVTLTVNPNTLQKTFGELERQGLVLTERASARFVTDEEAFIAKHRLQLLQQEAKSYAQLAKRLNIDRSAAVQILESNWNDVTDGESLKTNSPTNENGVGSVGISIGK